MFLIRVATFRGNTYRSVHCEAVTCCQVVVHSSICSLYIERFQRREQDWSLITGYSTQKKLGNYYQYTSDLNQYNVFFLWNLPDTMSSMTLICFLSLLLARFGQCYVQSITTIHSISPLVMAKLLLTFIIFLYAVILCSPVNITTKNRYSRRNIITKVTEKSSDSSMSPK